MSSHDLPALYAVFQQACDLPSDQRARFLDSACGSDSSLREQVERLLSRATAESSFLDQPAGAHPALLPGSERMELPQQIGKYQILGLLGRGGMGRVYLAEQSSPPRRVALKVLAPRVVAPQSLARFALEAEVLARLQHPGIAQIYETGTADQADGAPPYFAMEYVEGESLLDYATSHHLDASARLRLVMQLCQAVHHAHQKGVIHRDLKPANILVKTGDQLKVLDFGVARLTEADVKAPTLQTNIGELIGTIAYMSPEQAAGESRRLDTRSDVYALGVVAFQLLSGQLPYELSERMVHEAVRVVVEESPVPLSRVMPRLKGDLETILGKALEKEPDRRYPSAQALADDIQRYLNDEPISARPPSVVYQLQKFARRNALLVGSALSMVALLLITAVGMSFLAVQWKHQRDLAILVRQQAEQSRAEADAARQAAEKAVTAQAAISGFLQDVFAAGSPYVGQKDVTVAQALDLAAAKVQEKLAGDPEAAIAVRMRLADTYFSLGKVQESVQQSELALQEARTASPPNDGDIAMLQASLGHLYNQMGDRAAAGKHLKAAISMIDRPSLQDHPVRALALVNYGAWLLQDNQFDQATTILKQALAMREQEFGRDHPYTMTVRNNLAVAARKAGNQSDARRLSMENMESHQRVLGEKHPNTIGGIYNYADLLRELGEYDESDRLFQRSIELAKAHLPAHHYSLGVYRSGYGELLRVTKRFPTSEQELKDAYMILKEQLGPQHAQTVRAASRLAQLYDDWNRPEEAAHWQAVSQGSPVTAAPSPKTHE